MGVTMFSKLIAVSFVAALLTMVALSESTVAQDKTKRTGTVVGEMVSRKDAPNKINVLVEILGAGEEKARQYRVAYDPKVKGPKADVLKAVKAATIGDRVQIDWIEGEGYNITAFQVLKKKEEKKDK
jgi:hypothetical protein